jgi:hypothetical protein
MLLDAKAFEGSPIHLSDEDTGRITTLFFDDGHWAIRYIVIDTGRWRRRQPVLISPMMVRQVSRTPGWAWKVVLARARQPEWVAARGRHGSPALEAHPSLFSCYPVGPGLWGAMASDGGPSPAHDAGRRCGVQQGDSPGGSLHLRSTREVSGYCVETPDGSVGQIESFLIDDHDWAIHHVVVNTGKWWGGRRVLIAPSRIRGVHWQDSKMSVDMSREAIRACPRYEARHQT